MRVHARHEQDQEARRPVISLKYASLAAVRNGTIQSPALAHALGTAGRTVEAVCRECCCKCRGPARCLHDGEFWFWPCLVKGSDEMLDRGVEETGSSAACN